MKRVAATLAALAAGATVCTVRIVLAPIRWVGDLTANPTVEEDPLVWLPHEDDMDGWPELRVAPDPVVSHNGRGTRRQEQNR